MHVLTGVGVLVGVDFGEQVGAGVLLAFGVGVGVASCAQAAEPKILMLKQHKQRMDETTDLRNGHINYPRNALTQFPQIAQNETKIHQNNTNVMEELMCEISLGSKLPKCLTDRTRNQVNLAKL